MERVHEEIAGPTVAVASENAPRAIGAVSCRREAYEQQASRRITKARDRTAPVRLVAKRSTFVVCNLLTIHAEPGAALASDNHVVHSSEADQLIIRWLDQ
jgi:hypothetical protein